MNSRLNYSTLEDAWGIPPSKNDIQSVPLEKRYNYTKPKENILSIDSNEVKKPIRESFQPVKKRYNGNLKACDLIDDHLSKCATCRNKVLASRKKEYFSYDSTQKEIENFQDANYNSIVEQFSAESLKETFDNITPSQKNILIIILYGILVILISDLVIKEND